MSTTPDVIDIEAVADPDDDRPPTTAQPIDATATEADAPAAHEDPPDAPVPAPAAPAGLSLRNDQGARLVAGTDTTVVPLPNELDTLAQMAVTLSAAAAVPNALRGKPNDVFLILLTARDTGVALTTAMREFHVIDGKVTLSPKVKLAMVRQQGQGKVYPHQAPRTVTVRGKDKVQLCACGSDAPANGDTEATWHAERADEPGILHTSTFTMAMAERVKAKENGQNITLAQKSTWRQYPQRMLSWRALGYLLDDVFSEVGTGLYSPDEMGAVTDEDGNAIIDVVGSAQPLPGTKAPQGHNRTRPEGPPPADPAVLDELRERIGRLSDPAKAALRELWDRRDDDGRHLTPPLQHLAANQVVKAKAMIDSVEARQKSGEWGPPPDGDDGPDPAAAVADRVREDLRADIIAAVVRMTPAAIKADLDAAGLRKNGTTKTCGARLAAWRLREAGVATDEEVQLVLAATVPTDDAPSGDDTPASE